MASFGAVPDADLSTGTEKMSQEGVIVPATGRATSNFSSDSTVVDRPAGAEFCSRRFNTRRDTRMVENLYTYNQYSRRHVKILEIDGHGRQGCHGILE